MSGYELKLSRTKLRLKQDEFGREIGYTQQGVSSMESGRVRVPLKVEQKVRQMLAAKGMK